jgi:hypothetical protein
MLRVALKRDGENNLISSELSFASEKSENVQLLKQLQNATFHNNFGVQAHFRDICHTTVNGIWSCFMRLIPNP